jgi:GNAT superfamily N-acetyltransferase
VELDLRVVPAQEADLERAARFISDAFFVHEMMTRNRVSAGQLREELGDTGEMVEAWLDGSLVGTALIRPAADVVRERERPVLLEHSPALYFGLAGVRRDVMRRGVGREILAKAEETASERDYPRLLLSALREMGNVEYYLQYGYRVLHHWDFEREGD